MYRHTTAMIEEMPSLIGWPAYHNAGNAITQ
jgi:hypothetical protein